MEPRGLRKSGILIGTQGGVARPIHKSWWFALWYLQLSQNWRLPSVKISDFVTTMYRGIDTLIGYVLFRPRSPANQTSRSLSSIQTIYALRSTVTPTLYSAAILNSPIPLSFVDHRSVWSNCKTLRNKILCTAEIVDQRYSIGRLAVGRVSWQRARKNLRSRSVRLRNILLWSLLARAVVRRFDRTRGNVFRFLLLSIGRLISQLYLHISCNDVILRTTEIVD